MSEISKLTLPAIPEDAPFNREQRDWLTRYLSGVIAQVNGALEGAKAPTAAGSTADAPLPVTVLWGSQTGNAEGLASKFAKVAPRHGIAPTVFDIGQYPRENLEKERHLVVITSTYGDGEPPDNSIEFYDWLHSEEAPKLANTKFSVMALGDTSYPDFCKTGTDYDKRFEELGGERFYNVVQADVDFDDDYDSWSSGVFTVLQELAPRGAAVVADPSVVEEPRVWDKKNPFSSNVLRNFDLNKAGAFKETRHVELSLAGSGLEYEVGDALGLFPQNCAETVEEILANLPFNTKDEVEAHNGEFVPLKEALLRLYDIRTLNKKFLEKWSERAGSPYLRSLVQAGTKEEIDDFCWGRELIDLVLEYPADFKNGDEFVSLLRKLQPRLYSIASSLKAHPDEVHLTVASVRYEAHGRSRKGVASCFLADQCPEGASAPVFIHRNKAFRVPEDPSAPMIMVGPGTGIAPFRAFLEERAATGAPGKNWLFFGNPHAETDFLYEEDLTKYQKEGYLHRLDTAFSRDQAEKIYVQDRIREAGAELWQWLEEGGYFYVCGDASRMAKDVDQALHAVIVEYGGKTEEEAKAYVGVLKKEKRYARDVY
ncbi:MAG: assimilatory sulfite reductase (NADPH) flavoprotein subunit [Verrucomicrobiota bacterium]